VKRKPTVNRRAKRGPLHDPTPHAPHAPRTSEPSLPYDSIARVALAAFGVVLAWVVLFVHGTPLYGVETDLFGEAVPAARALLAQHVDATNFLYKGPGYPALLAGFAALFRGDFWLAARVLNLVAAVLGAWAAWRMLRRTLGPARACFATLALCANPVYVQAAVEAGTDAPTFALAMAATALVLDAPGVAAAALAGALAAAATLCRYNAAFLLPAAVLVLVAWPAPGRRRWPAALAFAAAAALVLGPWLAWNRHLHGTAFANSNYANLAFELYGNGMPWDRFWSNVAPNFHSFADVVCFDPRGAALHVGRNLATHWLLDLKSLMPVWLGAAAFAGALLHVRGIGRRLPWLVFYALCYATLAFVYYSARYFVYLLPFYLGAAALLVFPAPAWARRAAPVRLALAALAVGMLAVGTGRAVAALLAEAPTEMRIAAAFLREVSQPGDRVLARKPQVAYFAGMEYEPLPDVESVRDLIADARRLDARYLFLSGIEFTLRPQLRILVERDLHLPGLTPLHQSLLDPKHYGTVFRIEPASPADAAFDDSLVAGLDRVAPLAGGDPEQLAYFGGLYASESRWDKSLACLDRAIALDPRTLSAYRARAIVYAQLGRLDECAADCEHFLMHSQRPPAATIMLLGSVRVRQGNVAEALRMYELAAHWDPARAGVQLALGAMRLATGDRAGGDDAFGRTVQLDARLAPVCAKARERAAHGDTAFLLHLAEATRLLLTTPAVPLSSLADSVASGASAGR
jgi:tetratricopeptide (TPR) repeat protein